MTEVENLSFGKVLKNAREEQNISIDKISETLKLATEIIENIENSNSYKLPPAAFTCGYLRLFSKLVGVDEVEVIRKYNISLGEKSSDDLASRSDLPAQATSEHVGMRIASFSMIIVVIVLFVVWLQGNHSVINNDKENEEVLSTVVDNAESDSVKVDPASEISVSSVNISNTKAENTQADNLQLKKEKNTKLLENQPGTNETSVDNLTEEVIIEADPVDEEKEKIIALSREASPVASFGDDVIVLAANDNCWIEISDANDHLLYFSLLKKDEEVTLKGQGPFDVFLGKATAVSIILNDVEYDASPYIRNNQVARFSMSVNSLVE